MVAQRKYPEELLVAVGRCALVASSRGCVLMAMSGLRR